LNAKDRQSEAPEATAQKHIAPSKIEPETPTASQFSRVVPAKEHRPYSHEDLDREMELGFGISADERTAE